MMARQVAQLDAWIKANLVGKHTPWSQLEKAMVAPVAAPTTSRAEIARGAASTPHQGATAPPTRAGAQAGPVSPGSASLNAHETAVDQLLRSDPAARGWLRLVVETDARAPLPEPPPNLGYFAAA